MGKKPKDRLEQILTVVGWVIIAFAVIALIMFIINSGVLRWGQAILFRKIKSYLIR